MLTHLVLTLTLAAQDNGPPVTPDIDGDMITMTAEATDAARVHKSGNDFVEYVGEKLKRDFPLKVLDPKVELVVFRRGTTQVFRLTWSVRVVPTTRDRADCYFDRRGTIMSGVTLEAAQQAVEAREQKESKLFKARRDFEKRYGNSWSPRLFSRDSFSGSAAEGRYWYIQERFLTARNPQCK